MAYQKKILITASLYGAGGRETHLLKLCRSLVCAGAEITLVARVADAATPLVREFASIPVSFISTPFATRRRLQRLSTLWAIVFWPLVLRKQSFEVLYTFDISQFTHFLMRFLAPNGKLILNRAGDLITKEDWQSINLPRPDVIIVESDLQAQAVRQSGADDIQVLSIPMLGHYDNPPQPLKRHTNGTLRVSFTGRYDENKGPDRLLNAWKHLAGNDLRLCFYGNGDRTRLEESIGTRALTEHVSVKDGWQTSEELAEIFRDTDLLVLPSYSEGLPLILLEAMAHGVPFVATNVGAVRILAKDNPDVLVVENNDQAIKQGIEQMAHAIRAGKIDRCRLQRYHENHFDFKKSSRLWVDTLLDTAPPTNNDVWPHYWK